MNYRYVFIIAGLFAGIVQAEQAIKIVATDFDKVLSIPSPAGQFNKAMQAIGFQNTMRGLWVLATSSQARADFKSALKTDLRGHDNKPIIGSEAYVEYLCSNHIPFVSAEKRKLLANVELYFKPNAPLIEFYQELQAKGIPVYVWTDNDEHGFKRKLNALNTELVKLGKPEFKPDGFYCAKPGTKEPGYSKDDPDYFKLAYQELVKVHGNLLTAGNVLFIDDKPKNVASSNEAATKYGLNLEAFVYRGKPADLDALRVKFKV